MPKHQLSNENRGLLLEFRAWCLAALDQSKKTKNIEKLTLESTLVLAYCVKHFYNKKTNVFKPIDTSYYLTSTNSEFFDRIFIQFLTEVLVIPSSKNSFNSLEEFKKRNGEAFFLLLMEKSPSDLAYIDSISVIMRGLSWETNLDPKHLTKIINHQIPQIPFQHINDDYLQVWSQLIVDDCIAFTTQNCEKLVNQKLNITIQWIELFREISEHFSLGQILKIIYQCSSYSLRIVQENSLDVMRYQQILFDSIRNYSEKALINNWNIAAFDRRPRQLPQSVLSKIFFNEILQYKSDPINVQLDTIEMMKIMDPDLKVQPNDSL